MRPRPLVLENASLSTLLQYVMENGAAPSRLVVCSARDEFMDELQHVSDGRLLHGGQDTMEPGNQRQSSDSSTSSSTPEWHNSTLRLLSSSYKVKVAFCPTVTHLRAYLAAFGFNCPSNADVQAPSTGQGSAIPMLAILNCIQLHQPTSAFSAQGLNRTLALAVEAASRSRSLAILAECPFTEGNEIDQSLVEHPKEMIFQEKLVPNPWDQEVSMLNVTTKSFGAGERGWVGRTVKIRQIAGRWFGFESL